MNGRAYTCAICRDECLSTWSEAEALAELAAVFPGTPVEDCDPICDQCFRPLKAFIDACAPGEEALLKDDPQKTALRLMRRAIDAQHAGDLEERDRLSRMATSLGIVFERWREGRSA